MSERTPGRLFTESHVVAIRKMATGPDSIYGAGPASVLLDLCDLVEALRAQLTTAQEAEQRAKADIERLTKERDKARGETATVVSAEKWVVELKRAEAAEAALTTLHAELQRVTQERDHAHRMIAGIVAALNGQEVSFHSQASMGAAELNARVAKAEQARAALAQRVEQAIETMKTKYFGRFAERERSNPHPERPAMTAKEFAEGACPHCGGDGRIRLVNPLWLRQRRERSGLTLREMAKRLGIMRRISATSNWGGVPFPLRCMTLTAN